MADYTPNLNLRKPTTGEYYDMVADLNDSKDKIDMHAGQVDAQLNDIADEINQVEQTTQSAITETKQTILPSNGIFDWTQGTGTVNKKIVFVGDSTTDIAPSLYSEMGRYTLAGGLLDEALMYNKGANGNTLANFLANSPSGKGIESIIAEQAHVYIFSYGINDVRTGAVTEETLKANLKIAVDRLLAETTGYVLLRTPNSWLIPQTTGEVFPPENAQKYVDILWRVYESFRFYNPRVDVIDMQTRVFGRLCKDESPMMLDTLHPNDLGYRLIAKELALHLSSLVRSDYTLLGAVKTRNKTSEGSLNMLSQIFTGDAVAVGNGTNKTTFTVPFDRQCVVLFGNAVAYGNAEGYSQFAFSLKSYTLDSVTFEMRSVEGNFSASVPVRFFVIAQMYNW